jgi:hypothetical protein
MHLELQEVHAIGVHTEDAYRHNDSGSIRMSACQEVQCHMVAGARRSNGEAYLLETGDAASLEVALRSWHGGTPLCHPGLCQLRACESVTAAQLLSSSSYSMRGLHALLLRDTDMLLLVYADGGVVQLLPHEAGSWVASGDETGALVIIRRGAPGECVPPLLPNDLASRTLLQRTPEAVASWAWANVNVKYLEHGGVLHAFYDATQSTVWHSETRHEKQLWVQAPCGAVAPKEVYMDYDATAGLPGCSEETSFDTMVEVWAKERASIVLGALDLTWHGRQKDAPFAPGQWLDLEAVAAETIQRVKEKLGTGESPNVVSRRVILPHIADVEALAPGMPLERQRHMQLLWALDGAPPKEMIPETAAEVRRRRFLTPPPSRVDRTPAVSLAEWESETTRRIAMQRREPRAAPADDESDVIAMTIEALATSEATLASEAQHHAEQLRVAVQQDIRLREPWKRRLLPGPPVPRRCPPSGAA